MRSRLLVSLGLLVKKRLKKFLSSIIVVSKQDFSFLISSNDSDSFFGYYDISPFNPDCSEQICFHRTYPNNQKADIIYKDLKENKEACLGSTLAWNYQQGSRLTWLTPNNIIFNDYDEVKRLYETVVKDLSGNVIKKYPFPVQSFHKDIFFISIDYDRLREIESEYKYDYVDEHYPKNKVVMVNFDTEENTVLFGTENCLELIDINSFSGIDKEHINHICISDDGKKFIFIFRYYVNKKRIDNLFLFNILDKKLTLLFEHQLISHCCWKNTSEFMFWGRVNDVLGYYLYNITNKTVILVFKTENDGHPTFLGHSAFISDTYPNFAFNQQLFMYDTEAKRKTTLADFKHPSEYETYSRCDLHPSLSKNRDKVQVDFIYQNKRCIGIIDL